MMASHLCCQSLSYIDSFELNSSTSDSGSTTPDFGSISGPLTSRKSHLWKQTAPILHYFPAPVLVAPIVRHRSPTWSVGRPQIIRPVSCSPLSSFMEAPFRLTEKLQPYQMQSLPPSHKLYNSGASVDSQYTKSDIRLH